LLLLELQALGTKNNINTCCISLGKVDLNKKFFIFIIDGCANWFGSKHSKVYTKSNVSHKILGFYIKGLTNRWFYEDNIIIFRCIIS
jgi:hypothetical protein